MVQGYDHLEMLEKANTVAELAKITGMTPSVLDKTITNYNHYFKQGKDEAFNREQMPLSIEKSPYYAVKVAPGIHHTMGELPLTLKLKYSIYKANRSKVYLRRER